MTREPRDKPRRSPGKEDPGFYEALGRAIKVARADRGLERKELAELADVSYPYLSDIESGRGRPSSNALLLIADALQMPLHELLRSAERYQARLQGDEATYPRLPSAPIERASVRSSWFRDVQARDEHPRMRRAGDGSPPRPAVAGSATPAPPGPTPETPGPMAQEPAPRAELAGLVERLRPEDVDLVLELGRRLAREHPAD